MRWKYRIKVLGNPRYKWIYLDSWHEVLEEIADFGSSDGVIDGVFDARGRRVPV